MKNSRRGTVRKYSYLFALIAALAIWGAVNMVKLNSTERQMTASHERALTQLGTYMDTISTSLDKSVYASTPKMMSSISSEVWRASTAAKASLSEITDGKAELSSLYKFLSQVGEYTMSLNEKAAEGKKLTDEENQNLYKLKNYAGKINNRVSYLIDEEQSGGLNFENVKTTLADKNDKLELNTELENTQQVMTDYPTLLYDGPFSENVDTGKSQLTEGLDEVTKEAAADKAAKFLGTTAQNVYFMNESDGNLPCYVFYNANNTVSVTKKGGLISYMLCSDFAGESTISAEAAIKRAKDFLTDCGYSNMKESYYAVNDGICTVNFAYEDKGVVCYPDLVKVGISMENGHVMSFDSTGYLMNHHARDVKKSYAYTEETGKKRLNGSLTVKSVQHAFIPTKSNSEVYTIEYLCTSTDGSDVLVYLNPATGNEEEILLLQYSDGGVLTK